MLSVRLATGGEDRFEREFADDEDGFSLDHVWEIGRDHDLTIFRVDKRYSTESGEWEEAGERRRVASYQPSAWTSVRDDG